ncbi:MAG: threonine--tRNA ligase [Patescibacteria group bacterium]|jgi:threonyl-tRNA synthetase
MENNQIQKIRHSLSHLMTMAILEKYPKAKLGVGPTIENGFYQDYDLPEKFSEKDFEWIEKRMQELIKQKMTFVQHQMSFDEALKIYKDDPYKTELINDLKKSGEKDVSFYKSDWFENLCKGPHVKNTSEINPKSFKLERVAGAYWRGDEKNKMLQRIYGLAFSDAKELRKYEAQKAEAEKRDHRKLGKEMDLFTFSDLIGSGMPLYTPKGTIIRKLLNDYIEEEQIQLGYTQVWTPQIAKAELFKISGHYDKYKNDMFTVHSHYTDDEFFLKPMNCPQHTQIYASQQRSYKDLPLRYSDFAMLYRDEKPGELNGLARVRSFSQDDLHIFCREDQVDEEIDKALGLIKKVMETLGLKYRYRLSTRDPKHPEKYLGDPKVWDRVEKWAVEIMKRNKIDYFDGPGEAAFYAPKMDLMATDSLGREWQLSTVQIDFVMPARFGLTYTDKEGKKSQPVMLHRAILGSTERMIMILLEHLNGNLPVWLSPVQVSILSVSEKFGDKANELADKFKKQGIRVEVDNREESVGKKIAGSRKQKVPYTIVFGEREEKSEELPIRMRDGKVENFPLTDFIEKVKKEILERSL